MTTCVCMYTVYIVRLPQQYRMVTSPPEKHPPGGLECKCLGKTSAENTAGTLPFVLIKNLRPLKLTLDTQHDGLENAFPFRCTAFLGMLKFGGV